MNHTFNKISHLTYRLKYSFETYIKPNLWSWYTTGIIVCGGTTAAYIFLKHLKSYNNFCSNFCSLEQLNMSLSATYLPNFNCLNCINSWTSHMLKLMLSSSFIGIIVGMSWFISVPYIMIK